MRYRFIILIKDGKPPFFLLREKISRAVNYNNTDKLSFIWYNNNDLESRPGLLGNKGLLKGDKII